MIRVQNFDIGVLLDVARGHVSAAGHVDEHRFRAIGVQLRGDAFDIEDDFGNVFLYAGDRGDFVQHIVDLDAGNGNSGQGAQEDAAQGVSERNTVASFQGFDYKLSVSAIFTQIDRRNIRLFNLNHVIITLRFQCLQIHTFAVALSLARGYPPETMSVACAVCGASDMAIADSVVEPRARPCGLPL